jgi:hypothetical protein
MTLDRPAIDRALKDVGMNLLLMDGFDAAFIGYTTRMNQPDCAVYDYNKMVQLLMFRDGMSHQESEEYIEYNCVGAWVGEHTPYILRKLHFDELV